MATTKVSNILEVRLAIGPVAFLVDLKLISSPAADRPNQESAFFEAAQLPRITASICAWLIPAQPTFPCF